MFNPTSGQASPLPPSPFAPVARPPRVPQSAEAPAGTPGQPHSPLPAVASAPPEHYRQGELNPLQVQFQSMPQTAQASAVLQQALGYLQPYASNRSEDAPPVPLEQANALNALAQELGFPDFRRLQHACRNLPREVLVNWYSQLAPQASPAQQHEALKAVLIQALNARFQSLELPPPQLRLAQPDLEWGPAALLAIYNSVAEMQEQVPLAQLRPLLSQANGEGLIYEMHPPIQSRSPELIRALGESMKVARRDQVNGKIILHQGAVFPNPAEFVNQPQIQTLLQEIASARLTPGQASPAVAELQAFLNLGQPAGQALSGGVYDAATAAAVERFRTLIDARRIRDIVADDRQISEADKRTLLQSLDSGILSLSSGRPDYSDQSQAAALRNSLLTGERWHKRWFPMLSPGSQERIAAVLTQMQNTPDPTQFDAPLLENLTQFWFGMLDGGDNQDFTEQVLTHETGHILQNGPEVLENWKRISWSEQAETSAEYGLDHTLQAGQERGFVSPYATLSPEEDFAESYRTFVYQPERLLRESPTKFLFMASVTGRYTGKEQELLDFLESQGLNKVALAQEVARFRGYLPQLWQDIATQGGGGLADAMDGLARQSVLPLPAFSREWLERNAESVRTVFPAWAAAMGEQQSPRFTTRFAAFLSGLDVQLQLNFHRFRSQPHEEGYALEALAQWQKIAMDERQDPLTRAHAEAELRSFAENGHAIFSPEIQTHMPEALKALLEGESAQSNRALLVLLAKMVALGEGQQCSTDQRTDPLYAQLTPAAKALFEDPAFRNRVAMSFGQTRINPTNLHKEVLAEIGRLSQSNSGEFLRRQSLNLRVLLQSERNLNNAYRLYQQTVERFNAGQPGDPLRLLSLSDFTQLFREQIQANRPSVEDLQNLLGLREPGWPRPELEQRLLDQDQNA